MSDDYTIDHQFPTDDFPADFEPAFTAPKPVLAKSAADLQRKVFPPIRYVVPRYIVEGCTLFAGRPKLGKSWFMLEVGLAVARGGDCLGGIACEQGDVLYLALEDNERRLQSRITKMLGVYAQEWPAAFEYETEWRRVNEGGLDDLRAWILSKPKPRLIVADVLAMVKPVRGSKESLYEADYNAIKGLQALAGEFGIAIVIVHHTRKGGMESDPFEKVSGTLGLTGAADTTLVLDRDGNGATLYGRGRDIEEIESAVVFDKVGCRWHVQGEASEVRRTDERGSILAALDDATEPMSPTDIADATRMPNQNVRQLLVTMVKAGEVTKLGRGRYGHPDHNHTPHHNDHKITKLADYRSAKGGDASAKPVSEPEVCDRLPADCDRSEPLDHKPEAPAPSADSPLCDDVTDVTGGSEASGAEETDRPFVDSSACDAAAGLVPDKREIGRAFEEMIAGIGLDELMRLGEIASQKVRSRYVKMGPAERAHFHTKHGVGVVVGARPLTKGSRRAKQKVPFDETTSQRLTEHYNGLCHFSGTIEETALLRHNVLAYWSQSGIPTGFLDELRASKNVGTGE